MTFWWPVARKFGSDEVVSFSWICGKCGKHLGDSIYDLPSICSSCQGREWEKEVKNLGL